MQNLTKTFYIARKDAKIYFFKWPNVTYGLFLPAIIYLAFSAGGSADISSTIPGLVAMAALFGARAIESVALPLERAKGIFDRSLAVLISLTTIIVGKALAGFFLIRQYPLSIRLLPYHSLELPLLNRSFSFSVLGVGISASFRDIPEAMLPTTLLCVLMVFLGGVLTPIAAMPNFLQLTAYLLPLTYAVDMLRQAMTGQIITQMLLLDMAVLMVFSVFFFVLAVLTLKRTLH
jgi:ABC-2 type transport system permease protein